MVYSEPTVVSDNESNNSKADEEQERLAKFAISGKKHPIKPRMIHKNARKVTAVLRAAGFKALIVGGAIRDLYLGKEPKDFDVATDATPEQVKSIFKRKTNLIARIIGKRFKIVHVVFNGSADCSIVEVTTFRSCADATSSNGATKNVNALGTRVSGANGMLVRDNNFGTFEEDVTRRDFTINALYYDDEKNIVYDFKGGVEDIKNGQIDIIGDPRVRYSEDPVRMLRAIRFSAKHAMAITPRTADPIYEMGSLLLGVSNARMYDEMSKMFLLGAAHPTFDLMLKFGFIKYLFPKLNSLLDGRRRSAVLKFIYQVLDGTDLRINSGRPATIKFLFACLLWPIIEYNSNLICPLHKGMIDLDNGSGYQAFYALVTRVLALQAKSTKYPLYVEQEITDIWRLQYSMQLKNLSARKILAIMNNRNFKACYDFLEYRANANSNLMPVLEVWRARVLAKEKGEEFLSQEIYRQAYDQEQSEGSADSDPNSEQSVKVGASEEKVQDLAVSEAENLQINSAKDDSQIKVDESDPCYEKLMH